MRNTTHPFELILEKNRRKYRFTFPLSYLQCEASFGDFALGADILGGCRGCTGSVMIVLLPGDLIQAAAVDFLVDKGFAGSR